jgi:lysophospholipase L1-like esterase
MVRAVLTALWLLAACVPFLALSVELGARWWIRRRNRYYVFPPGWRLRLHLDPRTFPDLQPVTRFEINRDGERGSEPPRSAAGLYRVLVAGGSQPEGSFLDQDAAWPAVVQRLLERPDHRQALGASRVHVGSIGRSGVGSAALDLIFERVLPRYPRLQLIVVLVGVSDVLHWLEEGAPRSIRPPLTGEYFKCHPEGPFGWTPPRLAMRELLVRARYRWLRPIEVHERAGGWITRARAMRARAREVRTRMPDAAPMLDHFERHYRRLLGRACAHADRVLVIRQPWFDKRYTAAEAAHMWHAAVGRPWCEEVTTFYSFDVFSRLMALLDARAAAVCDSLQVEQLDLMPILDHSLATFYDAIHPTPEGAKAVAGAVAAAILHLPQQIAADADRGVAGAQRSAQLA